MSVRLSADVADESGDASDLVLRIFKWVQNGSKAGGFNCCGKFNLVRRVRCDSLVRLFSSMSFSLVAEFRLEESSVRVCHIVCGDGV
jgi:hypothetical protein